MENLFVVFACILLGVGLRAVGAMADNAAHVLNRFVIYIALPAIVLKHIHAMDFGALPLANIIGPASMPWLLFLGAWALVHCIGNKLEWDTPTKAVIILTAGLGNTSFVGFPLIDALYGAEGIKTAILVDQIGTFSVVSTLGIGVAIAYSGGTVNPRYLAKKLFLFPPFMAMLLALVTQPIAYPSALIALLDTLAASLIPLALTAVGLQLRINREALGQNSQQLTIGLSYKLLLAPLFFMLLYSYVMDATSLPYRVVVLEAAMAPMITAGIIASEYKLRPELGALMIGIGIPVSLLSVPLLNSLLW